MDVGVGVGWGLVCWVRGIQDLVRIIDGLIGARKCWGTLTLIEMECARMSLARMFVITSD